MFAYNVVIKHIIIKSILEECIIMDRNNRIIFHIDVNSAFLSWEACYRIQHGESQDLRDIPSVVGGDPKSRHGIVLAKSIPAKKYGITTGEPLYSAFKKYEQLVVAAPCYDLYAKCSDAMVKILSVYTPFIQRYSIDECFLDFTKIKKSKTDLVELAFEIKEKIKNELGFTVNIGISSNKLLAKMGSDFKKPDNVHLLFPENLKEKMWPLPVENLFMVGRATLPKLHKLNIYTIGDFANYDVYILKYRLKSHGVMIWNYANGRDDSAVRKSNHMETKGMGNSTTISFDVGDRKIAAMILLSLIETVGMRLRNAQALSSLISISIKSSNFESYSKQRKLPCATNSTYRIFEEAMKLFDEAWKGEPIRQLGIRVSALTSSEFKQMSIFDYKNYKKEEAIDGAVDEVRMKYGSRSLIRSVFLHSGIKALNGGIGAESYPVMSSIL